jgi:mono/diheme cytochrome c family protein
MKKIVLSLIIVSISLLAGPKELFNANCQSCHILKKGKLLSEEERQSLVAPPAYGVSKHTKERYKSYEQFYKFVSDYIDKPQKEKSICKQQVIDKYGLMPPIGKSIDKNDKKVIIKYLYNLTKQNKRRR